MHHAERGDDVDDLRCGEEPAEAEDAVRDAVRGERRGEGLHVLLRAEQDGAGVRPPRSCGIVRPAAFGEPRRDRGRFVVDRELEAHLGCADTGGRPRLERRHVQSRPLQRLEHPVGDVEDRAVVAPAGHQAVRLRGARAGEGPREGVQVVGTGAPPAVDRLVRVADGHHRSVAEQLGEEPRLDHRGVLVLVEQHDAVLLAEFGPHIGCGLDDVVRATHLIGEVEHAATLLLGDVVAHQARERGQAEQIRRSLVDVAVAPVGLERERLFAGDAHSVVDVDAVIENVAGEALHGVDDGAQRVVDLLELGQVERTRPRGRASTRRPG